MTLTDLKPGARILYTRGYSTYKHPKATILDVNETTQRFSIQWEDIPLQEVLPYTACRLFDLAEPEKAPESIKSTYTGECPCGISSKDCTYHS